MNRVLTHISHSAMACEFVIYLPQHVRAGAVDVAVDALDQLESIEQRLTVYSSQSEISRINQFAGQFVRVSHATATLVEKSLRWSRETNGAFDITAGPLIDLWGFTDRKGQRPDQSDVEATRSLVNYRNVEVDSDGNRVRLASEHMKMNLGAIGKGDAMDRIALRLIENGVTDFLLHAGASSVIARGDQDVGDEEVPQRGWRVNVAHPILDGRPLGHLWLHDQALSTSGSGRQFFHHQGKRYGHVLDPRTGWPAGQSLSVSVLADNATDADAIATAAFIMDDSQRSSLSQRCGVSMVVVDPGSRQNEVSVRTFGGPAWSATA